MQGPIRIYPKFTFWLQKNSSMPAVRIHSHHPADRGLLAGPWFCLSRLRSWCHSFSASLQFESDLLRVSFSILMKLQKQTKQNKNPPNVTVANMAACKIKYFHEVKLWVPLMGSFHQQLWVSFQVKVSLQVSRPPHSSQRMEHVMSHTGLHAVAVPLAMMPGLWEALHMPGKVLRADFFLISEGDFHSLWTLKKESYPCSASKDINGERPGDLPLDGCCFHRLGLPSCMYGHCLLTQHPHLAQINPVVTQEILAWRRPFLQRLQYSTTKIPIEEESNRVLQKVHQYQWSSVQTFPKTLPRTNMFSPHSSQITIFFRQNTT